MSRFNKIKERMRLYKNIIQSEQKAIGSIKNNDSFYASELIRYTHSMEKGLSIAAPKLGFGHEKQKVMIKLLNCLKDSTEPFVIEARKMAVDSLYRYIKYHRERKFTDEMINEIESVIKGQKSDDSNTYGGTVKINRCDLNFDTNEIERFFNNRHSIRDFDSTDIDEDKLMKALILAQRAPSACNRQGYRVHILSKEKSKDYAKTLGNIGGFAESVNRFIMITGKLSAYREDEINQYIVSASMYAAYLTLTLHLYGMGACVIQRPLIWDKTWNILRNKYNIPADEQLICLLSVGNLKDETVVPQSHRLSSEVMFKFEG